MSDVTKLQPRPISLPVCLHPGMIERHFAQDHPNKQDDLLTRMRDVVEVGRETGKKIIDAHTRVMSNAMNTDIRNQSEARKAATKLFESFSKRFDEVNSDVLDEIAAIEKKLRPPAPRDAIEILVASEIRSSFANLNPQKRQSAIQEALADGDDDVIGALCNGPRILTGMGQAEREMIRHSWAKARHPADVDRLERYRKAATDMENAGQSLMKFTFNLTDGDAIAKAEA
jgi:hypothetical protein